MRSGSGPEAPRESSRFRHDGDSSVGSIKTRLLLLAIAAASAASGRDAAAGPLGVAGDYSEFILGSATHSNGDVTGRMAVGGSAVLTNFAVGNDLANPRTNTGNVLLVGGSLVSVNAEADNGNVVVGGALSGSIGHPNGSLSTGVSPFPIDFAAQATFLQNLSTSLGGMAANGTVSGSGALTLQGTGAIDIFSLTGAQLSAATSLSLSVPTGATVIVNVTGDGSTPITFHSNIFFPGSGTTTTLDKVLFNFTNATPLTIANAGIEGSILAPFSAVTGSNANVEGNLIAATISGSSFEVHDLTHGIAPGQPGYPPGGLTPFDGTLPTAVPEPSSLAMGGVAALAGLACLWRRRRMAA
jgi:choice-of-anchor A domain-containing protein